MSNPYDPHNAPTEFPGGGHQPPQQPPPPPQPQQPYPTQQFPQPPQQPYPTQEFPQQPPPGPPPGGGYGSGPGGPGFGAPGGYGAPGFGGPPRKSRAPLVIGAVVLALVVIGGGIGGFFLLSGGDDDTDKASDDSSQTVEPETEQPESEEPTEEPAEEPTTEEPAEEPSESAAPSGGFDPSLTPVVGLWEGTYTCAQGDSKLDLAIAPSTTEDGALDAVFEFGPTEGNPDQPEGSFLMTGYFTSGTLALNGYQWIEQPTGYVFVDLVASVEGELPDTIEGEITTDGCTSFTVSRALG